MASLPWLDPVEHTFPEPELAFQDPNGLLAAGGDLNPERIIKAYQSGIFPWYEEGQPILWWSPNPRMVLFPKELHISKSLRKSLKKNKFQITYDQDFRAVVAACAGQRRDSTGTWITQDMLTAYVQLHTRGYAHSVEAWYDNKLVGGLYGLALGRVFFGESMFSHVANASKIAFTHLVKKLAEQDYLLIDCQVASEHLASFGAREISRQDFLSFLAGNTNIISNDTRWGLK